MSTILTRPENTVAKWTPFWIARREVDKLMQREKEAKETIERIKSLTNGNDEDKWAAERLALELKRAGGIYVWLDSGCYGNSTETGYYYVRNHPLREAPTTAYDFPVLIVKRSKLREDQIEFMERKCMETKQEAEEYYSKQSK